MRVVAGALCGVVLRLAEGARGRLALQAHFLGGGGAPAAGSVGCLLRLLEGHDGTHDTRALVLRTLCGLVHHGSAAVTDATFHARFRAELLARLLAMDADGTGAAAGGAGGAAADATGGGAADATGGGAADATGGGAADATGGGAADATGGGAADATGGGAADATGGGAADATGGGAADATGGGAADATAAGSHDGRGAGDGTGAAVWLQRLLLGRAKHPTGVNGSGNPADATVPGVSGGGGGAGERLRGMFQALEEVELQHGYVAGASKAAGAVQVSTQAARLVEVLLGVHGGSGGGGGGGSEFLLGRAKPPTAANPAEAVPGESGGGGGSEAASRLLRALLAPLAATLGQHDAHAGTEYITLLVRCAATRPDGVAQIVAALDHLPGLPPPPGDETTGAASSSASA
jgi:hypothetical protein